MLGFVAMWDRRSPDTEHQSHVLEYAQVRYVLDSVWEQHAKLSIDIFTLTKKDVHP